MYKRILGPLDGSKLGECTISHVKAIASGCKVPEVVLLTVLEPLPLPPFVTGRDNAEKLRVLRREQDTQIRQKAQDYLAKMAKGLEKDGLTVKTEVIPTKEGAAEGILDYAKKNDVDLIVLSTHGRSGITRWALGSVADRVVRTAQIPVLAVTPRTC